MTVLKKACFNCVVHFISIPASYGCAYYYVFLQADKMLQVLQHSTIQCPLYGPTSLDALYYVTILQSYAQRTVPVEGREMCSKAESRCRGWAEMKIASGESSSSPGAEAHLAYRS